VEDPRDKNNREVYATTREGDTRTRKGSRRRGGGTQRMRAW
jgi:hypothetical protein